MPIRHVVLFLQFMVQDGENSTTPVPTPTGSTFPKVLTAHRNSP